MKIGQELTVDHTVRPEDSAGRVGSGLLDVFSTPAMIALMEKTSMMLVQEDLDEGMGTVGSSVCIKHLKASRIGAELTSKAKLLEIDGKRLVFEVQVFEGDEVVGRGEHERFIIDEKKFLAKLGL